MQVQPVSTNRKGRKRKSGYRQPNGQLQRQKPIRRVDMMWMAHGDCAAVYVIEVSPGVVKIGHSVDPNQRLSQLQVGQSNQIYLMWHVWLLKADAVRIERLIHQKLKHHPAHANGEVYYFDHEAAQNLIYAAIDQLRVEYWPDEIFRSVEGMANWQSRRRQLWESQPCR